MLNLKNNNKGQVLIIVALSLVVFIGFLALALDVAYFYHTRHQLQGAADAAALAGAAVLTCSSDTGTAFQNQTGVRREAIKYAGQNTADKLPVALASNNSKNIFDNDNDITVGNWDGANYTEADGAKGFRINAVRVRARRTDDPALGTATPQVGTFFGKIFGVSRVSIKTEAIARGCYIRNFTPISVNEYWMGEGNSGATGGCSDSSLNDNKTFSFTGRTPYGVNHVYPNSFVRPPCVTSGAVNCSSPANGNVFKNYSFTAFKTLDCNNNPVTPAVTPNGPLPSDIYNCASGPPGPGCYGRVKPMSGRVFAILGGNANSNDGGGHMYGLIDLNSRTSSSDPAIQSWYDNTADFMNSPPLSSPQTNNTKALVAGYVAEGTYPFELPTSVQEIYQSGYAGVSYYTSSWPYASLAFYDGQGVAGQEVKFDFYNSGDYSNGRYKPGDKIVVAVYDGIATGNGSQERTNIVGFARITICAYGKQFKNQPIGYPFYCQNQAGPQYIQGNPQETLYGYVESPADAITKNVYDFYRPGFKSTLVR